MYLSQLELQGFKSFAEETTVTFDPGITTIVGPNGCGKSNIVDAIRWVIGEQRPTVLRSKTMENLIFNGTANRRPIGMAEVQLTIENTDGVLPTEYAEVTIGRRLFRDGTSEYLMNGTTCRLKDITDLFMDTGMAADAYSVIELKMIDEILSGSTEDRRRMFEEAAGVTRYKMRRRQALRKLENTQADLERIRDLTDEIGTQVERLERQAEKAQQYREAKESLEHLELLLSQVEYNRLAERQATLREERNRHADRAHTLADKAEAEEDQLKRLRSTVTQREETLHDRREALQEHRDRLRELEADQRLHQERRDRARSDLQEAKEAQRHDRKRRDELREDVQRLESTLEQARPTRDEAERTLETVREKRENAETKAEEQRERVQHLRERAEHAADEQSERRRHLDQLTNRKELLDREHDRARRQRQDLETKSESLAAQLEEAETALQSAKADVRDARETKRERQDEQEEKEEALRDAEDRLRELERKQDAAASEVDLLEGLVSSYDELSDAVQYLATDGPLDDLKTVADVLACDDEVRMALDAALGDLASCVVVPTPDAAQSAISRLREADAGQASFVILSRLPEPPSAPAPPGNSIPLRDAVRVSETGADRLASVLLSDCYLTDTLHEAEGAATQTNDPVRVFSRTGEWVDARGLLRGGGDVQNASPVASRFGRREQLEAAQRRLEELQQACDVQKSTVDEARTALQAVDLAAQEEAVQEAEAVHAQAEKNVERLRYETETVEERREEVCARLDEIEDERTELEEQIDALRTEVEQGAETVEALRRKRAAAESDLETAEKEERSVAEAFNEANVAAVEARNRVDNLERELQQTRERIEELNQRIEQRAEKMAELEGTMQEAREAQADLNDSIRELEETHETKDQSVQEAEAALQETKEEVETVEGRLRRLRQERESILDDKNEAAVHLAETETRMQDLRETVKEDFDRNPEGEPVSVPDDFDAEAARDEVRSLRGTLNALGDVNPLALEEYREEKERLDFLQEQKNDLEEAEETLLETIKEINSTASARFLETFDEIRESFGDIFTELFGGEASAELQLEDPDDPIDSPIEIVAKPRGKRPVTLDQLSSGEKALTATALLFAIYLVKPSPFCVLDEVDAPLDDANVERFMNLIRRFEDDTQFILVTHNQRTMELSDQMYGVTMEEQGVSTLVGVEFDEAVHIAG